LIAKRSYGNDNDIRQLDNEIELDK